MSTVCVIGPVPADIAAFHAADLGMQVTLIDAEPNPGGVCTFKGCIPSKALLHAAKVLDEAKHADDFGVSFGKPSIDVDKLRALEGRGRQEADRRPRAAREGAEGRRRAGPRIVRRREDAERRDGERRAGRSRPTTSSSRPARGRRRCRACRSTARRCSIRRPRSSCRTCRTALLVVGGGYIGLELGTVYAALGSKVTVVEMTDGLLPGADRDLAAVVAKRHGNRPAKRFCSRRRSPA